MKQLFKLILVIGVITASPFFVQNSWAHGDHEHEAGDMMSPKKGGIVKKTHDGYLELVSKNGNIKVYFFDGEQKEEAIEAMNITAKAVFPRKAGEETIVGAKSGNVFELNYTNKKYHRYELVLTVKEGDHLDNYKFNIEKK